MELPCGARAATPRRLLPGFVTMPRRRGPRTDAPRLASAVHAMTPPGGPGRTQRGRRPRAAAPSLRRASGPDREIRRDERGIGRRTTRPVSEPFPRGPPRRERAMSRGPPGDRQPPFDDGMQHTTPAAVRCIQPRKWARVRFARACSGGLPLPEILESSAEPGASQGRRPSLHRWNSSPLPFAPARP